MTLGTELWHPKVWTFDIYNVITKIGTYSVGVVVQEARSDFSFEVVNSYHIPLHILFLFFKTLSLYIIFFISSGPSFTDIFGNVG